MGRVIQQRIGAKSIILSLIVVGTIGLAWKYPLIGFVVPVVMMTGFIVGVFRGRYTCGNLCPRGAFYTVFLRKISRNTAIPPLLKDARFRWSVLGVMMTFMAVRVLQNPTSVGHLGITFWSMCAVTTAVGVILGIIYKPRTWCSFCPVGLLQNAAGGHRNRLQIGSSCAQCKKCERVCPLDLPIVKYKDVGESQERDCLKCRACTEVCPKKILDVPSVRKAA